MHKHDLAALPPHARRAAQVSLLLQRDASRSARHCRGCGALPALCCCAEWRAQAAALAACPHAVSVFLHPRELHRSNSTHHCILALLGSGRAAAVVVAGAGGAAEAQGGGSDCGGDGDGGAPFVSAARAYADVQAACAASGRSPVVLFPSAAALTVAQWRAASDAPRGGAHHVILLDSTWSESQCMARELAALGADFVRLSLPEAGVVSLFQACRKQPAEGKVCTAEALAYFFNELAGGGDVAAGAPCGGSSGSPFAGPHLHFALLPSLRSAQCRALLYALAVSVDRQSKQTGLIKGCARSSRGAGFRTWRLGAGAGPWLGALPAWLLERVCELAYGRGGVCSSGYFPRSAGSSGGGGGGGAAEPAWVRSSRVPLAHCSRALSDFARGVW